MSPKETEWWYHDDKASLLTQMLLPPIIFFHASEYILARAIHGPSRGLSSLESLKQRSTRLILCF
ncbi:hypothetical protein YC2023_015565 [Brassica napus]